MLHSSQAELDIRAEADIPQDAERNALARGAVLQDAVPHGRRRPHQPRGLIRICVSEFRSYHEASIDIDPVPVILLGENGAGKTNLIEAISLLGPGRGLRGAALPELARRNAADIGVRPSWAVAVQLQSADGVLDVGTGTSDEGGADNPRRIARRNGATVGLSTLAEDIRLVWITPAMDRLFLEGASERRRFLDRLVLALDPSHAARSSAYERAMRERNRLLRDGPRDPFWLDGLELEMARHGTAIAAARLRLLDRLGPHFGFAAPFPSPLLRLEGQIESRLYGGERAEDVAAAFSATLVQNRKRDELAGRTLAGPHISDLSVINAQNGQAAALCSTGEQKALLISIILAQARLLSDDVPHACPVLLLDEITAHLDQRRRAQLFDALTEIGLQAWLTGTDAGSFSEFGSRAMRARVTPGRIALC